MHHLAICVMSAVMRILDLRVCLRLFPMVELVKTGENQVGPIPSQHGHLD